MMILGIDPGFDRCGFAIVKQNSRLVNIIETGLIETPKDFTSEMRLYLVGSKIQEIVKKFKPNEAALEKVFFFKNKKTALNISEIVGALKYILTENKIKISFYTPLQVKQSLTGYGKADKKQIYYMLKQIFKNEVIPKQDDAADALAIAIAHIFNNKHFQ